MKKNHTYQQSHKISFKKWRRTSWAVFASLKVVVHSCCTRISSFKNSLLKQQGASRNEIIKLNRDANTLAELEDLKIPWLEILLNKLRILEILQIKITAATFKVALPCFYISLLTKLRMSVGIFYTQLYEKENY